MNAVDRGRFPCRFISKNFLKIRVISLVLTFFLNIIIIFQKKIIVWGLTERQTNVLNKQKVPIYIFARTGFGSFGIRCIFITFFITFFYDSNCWGLSTTIPWEVQLSALPKDTTSKLLSFFFTFLWWTSSRMLWIPILNSLWSDSTNNSNPSLSHTRPTLQTIESRHGLVE